MTDHWSTIPSRQPIGTGYRKWLDLDMWYPCVKCGTGTNLHVVIESIPPSPFCSIECMGEDVRLEVVESKRTENAAISSGAQVEGERGPDAPSERLPA